MALDSYAILRTSWIYSTNNCKSFIHKFLKNCIKKYTAATDKAHVSVGVTSNEYSIPTSCAFLVKCIDKVVHGNDRGVLHAVPSGDGLVDGVSRYDFAKAILEGINRKTALSRLSTILGNILIEPTLNSGYYPTRSTLYPTFEFAGCWRYYLDEFIQKNLKNIEDYCMQILEEETVPSQEASKTETTA